MCLPLLEQRIIDLTRHVLFVWSNGYAHFQVITANLRMLILNKLSMSDEFGFKFHEIQNVLMTAPKLFTMNKQHLLLRFDILHGEIGYDHEMIATVPKVILLDR